MPRDWNSSSVDWEASRKAGGFVLTEPARRPAADPLTHAEAARLGRYCPMCRFINYERRPRRRTCTACKDEGYVECCFADGRSRECARCRHDRERFEERRERSLRGEQG